MTRKDKIATAAFGFACTYIDGCGLASDPKGRCFGRSADAQTS
jgi:hypothetical protein